MKKLVFSLAILATIFTGCSDDDEDVTTTPIGTGEITGDITTAKEYPLGNYTIKGTVKVKSGASLRIAAGSTITADVTNGPDALLIENGGKLFLEGTAALPIVFTETSKTPGSWGGIIMFGDAPIVGANGVVSATSEDGNAITYGGTNPTHNGGILKYVRVEFAGKKLTDNTSEMNGFSFYSVGSGTVLENLVSYKGADDGYEFYGGTVTEGGSSAAEYDAIQFKKEGNGDYSNIVISGYTTAGATAVRIQDANTNNNQVNGSKIKLTNVKINDGTSEFGGVGTFTVTFPANQYTTSSSATGATLTPGAWAIVDGVNLIQ